MLDSLDEKEIPVFQRLCSAAATDGCREHHSDIQSSCIPSLLSHVRVCVPLTVTAVTFIFE